MMTRTESENVLRRLFSGGRITRLPRRAEDAELFLALAASSLDPRHFYTEAEINVALQEWKAGFTGGTHMDHVTLRRCLVDNAMVLRDDAGERYTVNGTIIAAVIDGETSQIRPLEVFEEVEREREARRANFQSS